MATNLIRCGRARTAVVRERDVLLFSGRDGIRGSEVIPLPRDVSAGDVGDINPDLGPYLVTAKGDEYEWSKAAQSWVLKANGVKLHEAQKQAAAPKPREPRHLVHRPDPAAPEGAPPVTVKLRALKSFIVGRAGEARPGDTFDVPIADAQDLIRAGQAEPVDQGAYQRALLVKVR